MKEKFPNTRKPSHNRVCGEFWNLKGQHNPEEKKNNKLSFIIKMEPVEGQGWEWNAAGSHRSHLGSCQSPRLLPLRVSLPART